MDSEGSGSTRSKRPRSGSTSSTGSTKRGRADTASQQQQQQQQPPPQLQNIVDAALQSPTHGGPGSGSGSSSALGVATPSTPSSGIPQLPADTPSPASQQAAVALTQQAQAHAQAQPPPNTRSKRGGGGATNSDKRGQKRKSAAAAGASASASSDTTPPDTPTDTASSSRFRGKKSTTSSESASTPAPASKPRRGSRSGATSTRTSRTTRGKHVRVTMDDDDEEDAEIAELTREDEETEDDYEDESDDSSSQPGQGPRVPAHLAAPRSHIHPAFLRQNFNSKLPYMTTNVKLLDVGRVDDLPEETWATLQKQFDACLSRAPFRRWLFYEWFYSSIDRPYFHQNEFIEVLEEYGFENMTKLTRHEWGKVRKVLGRPRRVSVAFFKQERMKLHAHRCEVRAAQGGAPPSRELAIPVEEIPIRLQEGQHVTALHPENNELHTGTVVGHAMIRSASAGEAAAVHYRIKFERPELPPALVPDYDVMPHAGNTRNPGLGMLGMGMGLGMLTMPFNTQLFDGSLFPSSPGVPASGVIPQLPAAVPSGYAPNPLTINFPHAEGDVQLIATLLKLLDRKKILVDHLHNMNTAAENIKILLAQEAAAENKDQGDATSSTSASNPSAATNTGTTVKTDSAASAAVQQALVSFRQQYAWVIVQLEKTSQNLESALLKLRIRRSGSRRTPSLGSSGLAFGNPATLGPKLAQHCRANAIKLVMDTVQQMMTMREIPVLSSLGSDTGMAIKNVISSCLTLIMLIQNCVACDVSPDTVDFKSILETLRPNHPPHIKHFTVIEETMNEIIKMLQTAYSERPHNTNINPNSNNNTPTQPPAPPTTNTQQTLPQPQLLGTTPALLGQTTSQHTHTQTHAHHNQHSPDVDAMI